MKTNFRIIVLSIFMLSFLVQNISAQVKLSTNLDDDFYQLRVKHIEDFMNRFNYTHDARGNEIAYNDSLKDKRAHGIIKLFSEPLIEQYCEFGDEGQVMYKNPKTNILSKFLQTAALDAKPLYLTLGSKKWMAENKCAVKYNGKEKTITLFMSFVFDADKEFSKWVIDSCSIPFLDIAPEQFEKLSPVSHNMNYMDLGKMAEATPENFAAFAYDGYKPDYLSILFYLIKYKQMVFEHVTESKFHFLQIPGYCFTVENVKEDSAHSGWLITEFKTTKQ